MPQTPKERKSDMVCRWKKRGVNPGCWTWDELYEIWLTAPTCWECNVTLTDGRATDSRCLDHDHDETGCFRAILCRGCNTTGLGADITNIQERTALITGAGRSSRRRKGTRDAPPLMRSANGSNGAVGSPEWKAAQRAYQREWKREWTAKQTPEWHAQQAAYLREYRAKKKLAKTNGEG